MVDRALAEDWVRRYVDAWLSYDPSTIGDLFGEDAEYRYRPNGEPVIGREGIVESWLATRDDPGTYHADYSVFAVEGERAVVTGVSTYFEDDGREAISAVYDNCFLIEFDDEGRCLSFTEWFIERRRGG
jgi:nuclear transport factor 2 (NTF2) superfamily protein